MTCSAIAGPVTTDVARKHSTIIKAASSVLTAEGYAVRYSNPTSGELETNPRPTPLTTADADCGKMFGFSYLKDKRTETTTAVKVTAIDGRFTVAAVVEGVMRVGSGQPDKQLGCHSLGTTEATLATKILAAALQAQDDPEPSPASQDTTTSTTPEADSSPAPTDLNGAPLVANPKAISDALSVVVARLQMREVNYRQAVALSVTYKSKTTKRIIGLVVRLTVTDPFGNVTLRETLQDATTIEPGTQQASDAGYYWPDNPFIHGEPFDRMAQSVGNGSAKVQADVTKLIFDDGTTVETNPKPQKKPR